VGLTHYRGETALVVQLIHLRDQHAGLVAEHVVDYVRFKGIVNAVFMPHDLGCWVHLESKVCKVIL
jgi:hypothetical protein